MIQELIEIVSDEDVNKAFQNTNFGSLSPRDVIRYSLLKYASVFSTGHTAMQILQELNLIGKNKTLTKKGKLYLLYAFYKNQSL